MSTPTVPFYPMTHDDALALIEAVQPTNVCVDLPYSIPTDGWAVSAPFTHTYLNNKITPECAIKVSFSDGSDDVGNPLYIEVEKVSGGVKFTAPEKPTVAVPVIIHVLNAEAESITSVSADMVSTDAVSGASNVQQALATHTTQIGNVQSGTNLQSQITALNGKTVNYNYLGACASASALGTALDGVLANMGDRTSQQVYFYPTVSFSGFNVNVNYFGTLRRSGSATSATVDFYPAWKVKPMCGTRDSTNGWVFEAIALKSDIIKTKSIQSPTTDGNGGINTGLYSSSCAILCVNSLVSYAKVDCAGTYNDQWILQAYGFQTGSILKNQSIGDIVIFYIEK